MISNELAPARAEYRAPTEPGYARVASPWNEACRCVSVDLAALRGEVERRLDAGVRTPLSVGLEPRAQAADLTFVDNRLGRPGREGAA